MKEDNVSQIIKKALEPGENNQTIFFYGKDDKLHGMLAVNAISNPDEIRITYNNSFYNLIYKGLLICFNSFRIVSS